MTGVDNWIGGSSSSNRPGINFQMGWDRAKNTGGIVFNTTVPNIAAPPSRPTILNDILIENSSVKNTSWGGIVLKQYSGDAPGAKATGWGLRTTAADPRYMPFTNVTIQGNYITQAGTAYGTNGMLIDAVRNGLVQNNLVDRVGTSGIEFDYSDQVVAQHNEVTGTTRKGGGGDLNGLDFDMGVTNAVGQYNYLHNNGMGYLACACNRSLAFGTATFRYNVVANNSINQIHLDSTTGATNYIYNNTLYNTASLLVDGYGTTTMTNSIFYTTHAHATMTSTGVTYRNNLYGGTSPSIPAGESHAITGNPQFADATAGGTGTQATGPDLKAGLNWLIAAGSPAVRAGIGIANNGGIDYNGAPIPTVPDIGALQHRSASTRGLR
ncbi:right-handed parallel beta-helix repeat-containing protein [Kutzneria sp. NPDC051319]|uniref:right-handed parallel beta-helix repeat-containing protein n=1 Tax=Kutzneria sp. NPDC051319 TaxID=3155047 RepID=UPI00342E555F